MKKRVCFMGTPQFAVGILDALLTCEIELVALVTQPDKKVGRKQEVQATPVKIEALKHQIPVFQPEKIGSLGDEIKALDLDLIVTCAYGQFIPEKILNTPRYGAINVHASLLPKYRGGAPIHKAIICGETQSGISLMRMVKKMDAGDVLFQESCPIHLEDDVQALHDRLMDLGAKMIKEHLPKLFDNELLSHPQDEEQVTFAYNITAEEEFVDFNRPLLDVYNQIRGLHPWPVAHAQFDGKKVKLYRARMLRQSHGELPGTILGLIDEGLAVSTQDGILLIDELQLEGKKRMSAQAFYQGVGKQWLKRKFD